MVYRRRYGRRNFKRKPWWTRPSKRKFLFRRPKGRKVRAARRGGLAGPVFGQRGHWATLIYTETTDLNPGSSTAAVSNYGCNNVFDPKTGTGGHQPRGFDELMAFYKYAYVTSATCTMTPISNATEIPGEFFIAQSSDGTENWGADDNAAWETNLKRSRIALAGGWPFAGSGRTRNSVTTTWTAKQWFKRNVIGDEHYSNSASSGPSANVAPQFSCVYKAASGTDPAMTVFRVYIRYRVYFVEPIALLGS